MQQVKINTINNPIVYQNQKTNTTKIAFIPFIISAASLTCPGLSIANDSTDCSMNTFYEEHKLLNAKPEIGIDFGFTKTQFKQGHGDKMLNKNQFPINIFFGFNVTERFGVEIGYGETRKKHKQVRLDEGELAPAADQIDPGQYQLYNAAVTTSQPYVSLKYTYPINNKIQLYAAIGITSTKMHLEWANTYDSSIPGAPTPDVAALRSKSLDIRKTLPIAKLGLYLPITRSFALRFITNWSQATKLQRYFANQAPNPDMTIKSKNNLQYVIGLVYKI